MIRRRYWTRLDRRPERDILQLLEGRVAWGGRRWGHARVRCSCEDILDSDGRMDCNELQCQLVLPQIKMIVANRSKLSWRSAFSL